VATSMVVQSGNSPENPAKIAGKSHGSVYDIVTERILSELEKGEVPWRTSRHSSVATPSPTHGHPPHERDRPDDHRCEKPPGSMCTLLNPVVEQSHEAANRKQSLAKYPHALLSSAKGASDDGLRGESLREATTNTESNCGACQRRARSHAATVPTSTDSRSCSSQPQKIQTVSLASYNTTFSEPYIRWCCVDLLRPPRNRKSGISSRSDVGACPVTRLSGVGWVNKQTFPKS
jgi:hypothetical protein